MRVHLCGTRGSTQAPGAEFLRYGGHTSCVAIAPDGEPPRLLLDAGTGIRQATKLLGGDAFDGSILLSHLHWDHTHGLPFFRGGDREDARVDCYLPAQGDDPEQVLARGFSPPHFPIRPAQLRGTWRFHGLDEGVHTVEGFTVLVREIPHKGGRTFGFRVSDATGSLAYLADHHPASLGPGQDGFGPFHEAAATLAGAVDLLLHDAQYRPEEWADRGTFGHSTAGYAVGLGEVAGVGTVVLTHHDPARTDDEIDALLADVRRGANVRVLAAAEGDVLTTSAASAAARPPVESPS